MYEWFTASGEHIFWSEICNNIIYIVNHDPDHQVVIGADSQTSFNSTTYVISICLISNIDPYQRSYYYGKNVETKTFQLYDRIFKEANGAAQAALSIKNYSPSLEDTLNLTIHLDLSSPDKKHKTSKYCNGLTSFVKSLGFQKVKVKPDSWASSSIADKHTKK